MADNFRCEEGMPAQGRRKCGWKRESRFLPGLVDIGFNQPPLVKKRRKRSFSYQGHGDYKDSGYAGRDERAILT